MTAPTTPKHIEVNLTRLEHELWDLGYSLDQIALLLLLIERGCAR